MSLKLLFHAIDRNLIFQVENRIENLFTGYLLVELFEELQFYFLTSSLARLLIVNS